MEEIHHAEHGGQRQHATQGAAAVPPGLQQRGSSAPIAALFQIPAGLQQKHHAGDRQQVAGGINPQGPRRAGEGHKPAANRWTHQFPHVEHHRETGQITRQLLRLLHQQGAVLVAGSEFECASDAHQQRAAQQQQHLGLAFEQWNGQSTQGRSGQQGPLGLHQHPFTAQSIGAHSRWTADDQARQRQGRKIQRQHERIGAAVQKDPALGGDSSEGPGSADAGDHQEQRALLFQAEGKGAQASALIAATIARAPTICPLRS